MRDPFLRRQPRRARRVWAPALVGLLALSGVAAGSAAPAAAAGSTPAAARVPDIAAASLAADRGISLAEAQTRMSWQVRLPALADRLAGRPGYGGIWIDTADGDRVKVGTVGRVDVRSAAAAAGLGGAVDAVPVRHTMAELEAANGWLARELARVNAGAEVALSGAMRIELNAVELLSPARGTPTLAQQALLSTAQARYGAMLRTGTYQGTPGFRACAYPYCDPPLRGGIRILGGGGSCTGAFLARSRSDNRLYQFTAGHCAYFGGTGTWSTRFANGELHAIGAIGDRWRLGSAGDMAIIQVANPDGWRARAWVNVTASSYTSANQQYPIKADGGSWVGMRICTTGGSYGKSDCGNVQKLGVTFTAEGITVPNLGESNVCAVSGDSGAPMFASNTAYGLMSGGYSLCDTVYQGIHAAENALNVNVAFDGG